MIAEAQLSTLPLPPQEPISAQRVASQDIRSKPYSHIAYRKQEIVKIFKVNGPYDMQFLLAEESEKFRNLREEIKKHCKSIYTHPPSKKNLKPGLRCFVFSKIFKIWTRATILSFHEEPSTTKHPPDLFLSTNLGYEVKINVELFDYAKKEEVSLINTRESLSRLWVLEDFPKMLIKASLSYIRPLGDGFSPKTRSLILNFCTDQSLRMLVQKIKDGIYYCDIVHFRLTDVSTPLPSLLEYLCYSMEGTVDGSAEPFQYQLPPPIIYQFPANLLLSEDEIPTKVCHIESIDNFHVILDIGDKQDEKIKQELDETYQVLAANLGPYNFFSPKLNYPCLVKIEQGDSVVFRRALVIALKPPEMVTVKLVDIGRPQTFPLKQVFLIQDRFITSPRAILCGLHGIKPLDQQNWSRNAVSRFKELLIGASKSTSLKIIEKISNPEKLSVLLRNLNLQNDLKKSIINEILVDENYVLPIASREKASHSISYLSVPSTSTSLPEMKFSGYSIMLDLYWRLKNYQITGPESLIPVRISIPTIGTIPSNFSIQIATPEAQHHLKETFRRLDEHYSWNEQDNQSSLSNFKVGETCVFKYESDFGRAGCRRGKVKARIKRDREEKDPRSLLTDVPDQVYSLLDLDSGLLVSIFRRDMRKPESNQPFFNDEEFFLRCHISGINPIESSWSPDACQKFQQIINRAKDRLFIQLNQVPPKVKPDSLGVNLFYKEEFYEGALLPKRDEYISIRRQLVRDKFARDISDLNIAQEELISPNPALFVERQMPFSFYDARSVISFLKMSYYVNQEPPPPLIYPSPDNPVHYNFNGVVTTVDRDLRVWFMIDHNGDSAKKLGMVYQTIMSNLIERDRFLPFSGPIDKGRAITAYSHSLKKWFRGEIMAKKNQKIVVRNIDQGTVEEVLLNNMTSEILDISPGLALCGLIQRAELFDEGKTADDELLKTIQELVVGKTCKFFWVNFGQDQDMVITVTFDENKDLRQVLLSRDLIKESSSHQQLHPREVLHVLDLIEKGRYAPPHYHFKEGKAYIVTVPHILCENYMFLQCESVDNPEGEAEDLINRAEANFIRTTSLMRNNAFVMLPSKAYKPGQHVIAKYTDNLWYRAIVSQVYNPMHQVFFVDYGNMENVHSRDMREIMEEFIIDTPMHCFLVKVTNIAPVSGVWTQPIRTEMVKVVEEISQKGKKIAAVFKQDPKDLPYLVDLFEADSQTSFTGPLFNRLIEEEILKSV